MNLFDGATLISESSDESFMRLALEQACCAASHDEVPIGAVIVYDNRVIGWGYNLTRRLQDATAHAETVALRQAAQRLGHWYFNECTLYVTVEPCVMCAGMMILGHLARLVYGAREPKFGCCGSLYDLVRDPRFNHRVEVTSGVLAVESEQLLKAFFRKLRAVNNHSEC